MRRLVTLLALRSDHALRHLLVGFAAGGVGVALNVAIYAAAGWYHVNNIQLDIGPLLLSGLIGYLALTAIPEEIVFRGIVFRGTERGLGTVIALVFSSVLFGAVHLMNPDGSLVGALGTAVAGGTMLCAAYLVTRNLWLAIGIHWAADFWQGAFFGLRPSGTTFDHPLLHSTLNGPSLWTGGNYGGGIVGLAIGTTGALIVLSMARRRHHFVAPPWRPDHAEAEPRASVALKDAAA